MLCTHNDLKIGKMYDTERARTYSRLIYTFPRESKENICVDRIKPSDCFVLLELFEDNNKQKWTKILTSSGIVGWTTWLESIDSLKLSFKEVGTEYERSTTHD